MEPKNSKIFSRETMQAVSALCESENIKDIDQFMYLCFKQGFDIKKYGLLGETLNEGEKHLKTGGIGEKRVEIEVIREIRVEIPVEVIKEVEKIVEVIKEVTVEKVVIKEVPVDRVVEKIIYTTDNIQINELGGKIAKLEQELSTKTSEMENIFQNKMSKKDEELDELRRKLDDPVTNNKLNMLQDTLQNLRNDLSLKNDKINELEKINHELQRTANLQNATYMKGSNLNSRI